MTSLGLIKGWVMCARLLCTMQYCTQVSGGVASAKRERDGILLVCLCLGNQVGSHNTEHVKNGCRSRNGWSEQRFQDGTLVLYVFWQEPAALRQTGRLHGGE